MNQKTLLIALAGAPNAGKSTLINSLVRQKIAIVTSKAQTTRFNTKGVVNIDNTQLIFIDTPGLFKPNRPLEHGIVRQARMGLEEADIICLIVDSSNIHKQNHDMVINHLKRINKPIILLLNKIDLLKNKESLLGITEDMLQKYSFDAVFMISAKKHNSLVKVIDYLKNKAIDIPWIFEEGIASNITDRKLAEEITRERLYYELGSELPYSVEVQTELWEDKEDGSLKIHQIIHVLKDSQKKIILGFKGNKLKSIGQSARKQMNETFGRIVHLFLHVKIKEDWIQKSLSGTEFLN